MQNCFLFQYYKRKHCIPIPCCHNPASRFYCIWLCFGYAIVNTVIYSWVNNKVSGRGFYLLLSDDLAKQIFKLIRMIMKLSFLSVVFSSMVLLSCRSMQPTAVVAPNANDRLVTAVSWYQHSSEMMALYYQGFNLAKQRLDESVAANVKAMPLAVVVDVDETMLDNSPFETSVINNIDFQQGWHNWTSKASAKALPGAVEFAKYAQSLNIDVFYITNRDNNEREGTLKNLANEGFPFADEDHLLTRSDLSAASGNTSSKTGRRAKVAANHEIVLLVGDNLNDFSEIFEDRSVNDGKEAVMDNRELFGKIFIVLPNPNYGAWEKPLYNYKDKLTDTEKTILLKEKLIK